MFTIRNINTTQVSSISRLVELIRAQLKGDIIAEDFDVGYVSGNNLISLRNKEDVSEIWTSANRGQTIVLWCDGLKPGGTIQASASKKWKVLGSSATQPKKDMVEQVQQCVENLKKAAWWTVHTYVVLGVEWNDQWWHPQKHRRSSFNYYVQTLWQWNIKKKGSSVKEAMVDAVQQIASTIAIPHQGVWLINHPVMESLLVQVDSLMEGQNVINS